MAPAEGSGDIARFDVRNIGGIHRTEVAVPAGVTVLTGENATNRTSFLQAIIAAMGSTAATLKGDAEDGGVRLTLAGESYERRLERVEGGTRYAGEGYLDDVTVAELFAFLLENNEARRSVAAGGDLRQLLMRPVDTAAIRADIERLETEKRELSEQLSAIEERKHELGDLEARRDELTERIEAKRAELAETEAEIDETDIERHRRDRSEFEETLAELRSTRSELESVRRDIESQSESIASLQRERAELEAELEDLPAEPGPDGDRLDGEIRELRGRRQSLDGEIAELQSIIQYNEDRLADDGEVRELVGQTDGGNGAISEGLVTVDSDVTCWTCGSTVEREQIETTVDRLRQLREEKMAELESVKSSLAERKADRQKREELRRRRREIEAKLDDIESEQQRRESQLAERRHRRGELTDEVERLERVVQSLESAEFDEVLALHREANQLEFELDRLESDREDVLAEIGEIESAFDRAKTLRARRAEVVEALTDKRTRIERLEREAVESFNEHMAAVLDSLGYDNVERIWIERLQSDEETTFDLHIVRTTANGTAYEDSVAHLSESEREVTGLVVALAGYLVHDVHETVPFILLDSLEAIDADRIAKLVDYLADYADYLVVALLPEDARALDDGYTRITDI